MALLIGAAGCTACTRKASGSGAGGTPSVGRLGVGKPTYTNTGNAALLTDGAYRGANAWAFSGCSTSSPCWAAVHVGTGPSRLLVDWSYEDGDGELTTTAYGGTTVQDYTIAVSSNSTNGADGTWTAANDALHQYSGRRGRKRLHSPVPRDRLRRRFLGEDHGDRDVRRRRSTSSTSGTRAPARTTRYFFHGDSITIRCANLRGTNVNYGEQPSFQAAVQAVRPARYPLQTGGGIVGEGAADAVTEIAGYLPVYRHIKYWFLTMGTNDLCDGVTSFSTRAQSWIDAVKAAGHSPMLVHPIWGNNVSAYCSANGPAFNAAIDTLVSTNNLAPAVPLYEATVGHPEYFDRGDVHPNEAGCRVWNQTFATYVSSFGK